MSADRFTLRSSIRNIEESPVYQPISKVRIHAGENSQGDPIIYEWGNASGRTLDVENPWGTLAMAKDILAAVQGYAYKPFQADGAILNPAAEIGDAVSIGDVYSVIADVETRFTALMTADIGAPDDGSIDHEYPYESPANRELKRAITENRTALIVQEGYISTIVEELGTVDPEKGTIVSRLAQVEQTADGINVYVGKKTGWQDTALGKAVGSQANNIVNSWASLNFNADGITSKLGSKTYEKYGAAADAASGALSDALLALRTESMLIRTDYTSEISQTASEIRSTVAKSESKWDLYTDANGKKISSTVRNNIAVYGFGAPDNKTAKGNKNKYYLDQDAGQLYKSNGSSWSPYETYELQLITSSIQSSITQMAEEIRSAVSDAEAASTIAQRANSISLAVSSLNGKTTFVITDNAGRFESQSLDITVDVANIHGTLIADGIKAYKTIEAPYINGGTIDTAILKASTIQSSTIRSANIYSSTFFGEDQMTYLAMGYGGSSYGLKVGNAYGQMFGIYPSYSNSNRYISFLAAMYTVFSCDTLAGLTTPGGVWDFSACSKVKMPDGTVFE